MTVAQNGTHEQSLADYLAVVRRYKWLILLAVIVVPSVAYAMSAQQPKVFRASSDVLLNRQDLGSTLTGIPTQSTVTDPVRYARTQAQLARVPSVTQAAVERSGIENIEASELANSSDVTANPDTDILTFGVNHGEPTIAERLATAYADAFVAYKLETETSSLEVARREIQGRLGELREAGASNTDTYRQLVQQAQSIRTLELLQLPASVVRPALGAGQIAPTAKRNAILGVMLGLVLGLGGAFGLNAVDRRVRDAEEVERELQIPLLAKLPAPQRRGDHLTILDRPPDPVTEAVGRLRTSFDFANADLQARMVMATSAGAQEGKSTTIANLAIALSRTGRHVVLVDLDLRRPSLARLFHLGDVPGVTDAATRNAKLSDTFNRVAHAPLRSRLMALGGTEASVGMLEVVTAGRTRVDPGEFVETAGLTDFLDKLRDRAEIVLIDAPPILVAGDAMALTGKVDAILLINRLGTLKLPVLRELARVLDRSPAPVLGLVATGAQIDEGYMTYHAEEARPPVKTKPRSADGRPSMAEEITEPRSASAGSGRWSPRRSSG